VGNIGTAVGKNPQRPGPLQLQTPPFRARGLRPLRDPDAIELDEDGAEE
jgi:hypothetical protein